MNIDEFTLVPNGYKDKDPRQMAFNFRRTIQDTSNGLIIYNKYVQQFIYYHSLDVAEQFAKMMGFILLPSSCIHWRRAKEISHRRVQVGRKTFYALNKSELNINEKKKLVNYLDEIKNEAAI